MVTSIATGFECIEIFIAKSLNAKIRMLMISLNAKIRNKPSHMVSEHAHNVPLWFWKGCEIFVRM